MRQSLSVCHFLFFFQAEDGIRDLTVTGVQTCALPISPLRPSPPGTRSPGACRRETPRRRRGRGSRGRSEEHTSELQSQSNLVCRLLLEKKKKNANTQPSTRTILNITYTSANTS